MKKLIVFDLNGVLIKRQYDPNRLKSIAYGAKRIGNHIVSKIEYIDFNRLGKYYDIAVWSSMNQRNINRYLEYIFGDFRKNLKFVFSERECYKEERVGKPLFTKDSIKILQKFPLYSIDDIIIVDDSLEKIDSGLYGRHIEPVDYNGIGLADYLKI